jgi:hypothetical protein
MYHFELSEKSYSIEYASINTLERFLQMVGMAAVCNLGDKSYLTLKRAYKISPDVNKAGILFLPY